MEEKLNQMLLDEVLDYVRAERERQHNRFGEQSHPDGTGGDKSELECARARVRCDRATDENRLTWRHILAEEVAEALAETDPISLGTELVQVAAVCVAWVEALNRRT